jgi:hypothetical protein
MSYFFFQTPSPGKILICAGAWCFAGGIKYDSNNNSTDLGKKEKSQKNNKSKTRNAKYEITSFYCSSDKVPSPKFQVSNSREKTKVQNSKKQPGRGNFDCSIVHQIKPQIPSLKFQEKRLKPKI